MAPKRLREATQEEPEGGATAAAATESTVEASPRRGAATVTDMMTCLRIICDCKTAGRSDWNENPCCRCNVGCNGTDDDVIGMLCTRTTTVEPPRVSLQACSNTLLIH
ncbi:hypothetical protein EOD39_13999 [Acipenser ruthenus]|uniref:Uncharacterized protein n=1 Tax=Acipenser ruthenus TaxID=7906 RepID=A0A444UHC9_ACIRT|nr:hypothetical protein EOD39_13999 [Acipenser ruthenus]